MFPTGKNNEDIKEVQKQFTTLLNPTREKIKIRSLRTTKTAVIVETENEDVKKTMDNRKLKLKINCEKQRKKNASAHFVQRSVESLQPTDT